MIAASLLTVSASPNVYFNTLLECCREEVEILFQFHIKYTVTLQEHPHGIIQTLIRQYAGAGTGSLRNNKRNVKNVPQHFMRKLPRTKRISSSDEELKEYNTAFKALKLLVKTALVWIHYNHLRMSGDGMFCESPRQLLVSYPNLNFSDFKKKRANPELYQVELFHLVDFCNVMRAAVEVIPAKHNKGDLLKIVSKLTDSRVYVTGGRQTPATSRRVQIYQTEGQVTIMHKRVKYNTGFSLQNLIAGGQSDLSPESTNSSLIHCDSHSSSITSEEDNLTDFLGMEVLTDLDDEETMESPSRSTVSSITWNSDINN